MMRAASALSVGPTTVPHRQPVQAREPVLKELPLAQLMALREQIHSSLERKGIRDISHAQRMLGDIAEEAIQRPGFWNDGLGDLFPALMVKSDVWPADRTLRIIDNRNDAIHHYSPQDSSSHYGRTGSLLPASHERDIVLYRTALNGRGSRAHYMLVQPDAEALIQDVPADGDCFFSCISKALDVAEADVPEFNQGLRRSMARLLASDPGLRALAAVPDQCGRGRSNASANTAVPQRTDTPLRVDQMEPARATWAASGSSWGTR